MVSCVAYGGGRPYNNNIMYLCVCYNYVDCSRTALSIILRDFNARTQIVFVYWFHAGTYTLNGFNISILLKLWDDVSFNLIIEGFKYIGIYIFKFVL